MLSLSNTLFLSLSLSISFSIYLSLFPTLFSLIDFVIISSELTKSNNSIHFNIRLFHQKSNSKNKTFTSIINGHTSLHWIYLQSYFIHDWTVFVQTIQEILIYQTLHLKKMGLHLSLLVWHRWFRNRVTIDGLEIEWLRWFRNGVTIDGLETELPYMF